MRIRLWLLIISFTFYSCVYAGQEKKKISLSGVELIVDVSDTDQSRQKGLMFKPRMDELEGMLFIFENQARYSFWMKNMQFPIDIIWVSEDKKVVYIAEDALPCQGSCPSFSPDKSAKYVLELNSGFVKNHQVKVGDSLFFE